MKKIIFILLLTLPSLFQAQLFIQDFDSSADLADYVSVVPSIGEFNGLTQGQSGLVTSITNGALQFERTAPATMFAYRNFNFSENPTLVQFEFDFELENYESGTQNPLFNIFIGNTFSNASFGRNSSFASRLGIVGRDGSNEFRVTTVDNINGAPSSSFFEGKQRITFIINNSGSSQDFDAPDGNSTTIPAERMQVWVGTVKVIDNFPLRNTASPKADITGFKIQATSRSGLGTFSFDNIVFKDLLNTSQGDTGSSGTASLTHPHIWVSSSDKQEILNNISNFSWANSLFTQLQTRNSAIANNHGNNPSSEISAIPAIPGNRTTHRTKLNIGAESAILYYLTEDEKYAQLASDILNEYVKLLKDRNPVTLEFYAPNFNHLIQCRELFTRVAMIYDFVEPFLSKEGTTVYDLASRSQVPFNFDDAQKALEVMTENVIKVGGNGSNHPVLELPGALYSVMCMRDDAKREAYFNLLMNGAANSNQPGINWMLGEFSDEDRLWPEAANYAKFTHALFIQLMNVVDRYKPELNIIDDNKDLLESIFDYENYLYPNGATIAFGDIGRTFTDHAHIFRSVLEIADRKDFTDLKDRAASTLQKIYTEEGGYRPEIFNQRLEWHNPLQLLWGVNIDASVPATGEIKRTTITAAHAGVVMQRNYSGVNDLQNGLMYYTGGGTYVHAHATGLDMEIYGAGYVIGPDFGGSPSQYGTPIHEQYAVSYAAHNTIIVNGTSGRGPKTNGASTWQNIVDPIVLEASEPKVDIDPIAENFNFSAQFLDDNQNDVDQLRTNGIVRTSPTTGYYVDIFRSFSNDENNFHDYLFHGLGDVMQIRSGTSPLALTSTPNRYQNDVGDDREQPGWKWYSGARTSTLTGNPVTARFHLQATNDYLHVNVPGGINKEYSAALAPPTQEVRNGYDEKDTQMFIMRKYGEAWDEPFVALYEPSGNAQSTIVSSQLIYSEGKVVGLEVLSSVNNQEIRDIIIANDTNVETLILDAYEIEFTGRYAIVRSQPNSSTTNIAMYIGEGEQLKFLDNTLVADEEDKAFQESTLDFVYTGPASANNFTVEVLGETCVDKSNGSINITAAVNGNYTATLNGVNYPFNNSTIIEDLEPGVYELAITTEGVDAPQLYELTVAGGVTLSGKIAVGKQSSAEISIAEGEAPFTVIKNGEVLFETQLKDFSISVNNGDNIEVKSKSACQGILSKTIDLLEDVRAYPNPSKGNFAIFVSTELENVDLEIYNIRSQLIKKGTYTITNGKLSLDISNMPNGVYVVKMNADKPVFVKLIKN
ncbi:T9SS type A sorting domain-containing protein [uncultured Polaribacter sp.]|uniref:T9SS type A sorting domain-containing protein n=1 Tax=uncultured Polaribacter sp. TaxID=174711 RepID=UPI002628A420|nr:T9SS type A sorting domain-containing protein [uncultured Polaribacter sp.]